MSVWYQGGSTTLRGGTGSISNGELDEARRSVLWIAEERRGRGESSVSERNSKEWITHQLLLAIRQANVQHATDDEGGVQVSVPWTRPYANG